MQHKKRSISFILTLFCTFALLLAACRTGTSTQRHTLTQNAARLNLRETPGITTPGAVAPADYVGQIQAEKAWIGISTNGKDVVAFITDGSQSHKPTFAQWFKGPVTNGVVDTTSPAKTGTDRLQAMLDKDTSTGTITLANGKSMAFTANPVSATDQTAGLYRSERVANNQRYVAGWIILPAAGAAGTATPSATETTTPSATETTTPSATETTTPSATETTTPSATETATPSPIGALQQGGAILNEQNRNILPILPLTQKQIDAKEMTVPNLGTFKLVRCQKGQC